MKRIHNISIKAKLLAITVFTSSLVVALILLCSLAFILFQSRMSLLQSMGGVAQLTGFNNIAALTFHDQESASRSLTSLQVEPRVEWGGLFDASGELFAEFKRALSSEPAALAQLAEQEFRFVGRTLLLQHKIVVANEALGHRAA